ncbi:MAG: hypothetical protein PVI23_13580 [Maricaulaceae bacterium]|jgi:hypothetical protein
MSRRRFVIIYGVLGWGLGGAVLWSLMFSFTTSAPWWTYTIPAVIGFPAGGVLWGLIMWRVRVWLQSL